MTTEIDYSKITTEELNQFYKQLISDIQKSHQEEIIKIKWEYYNQGVEDCKNALNKIVTVHPRF